MTAAVSSPAPAFDGRQGYFVDGGVLQERYGPTLATRWEFEGDGQIECVPEEMNQVLRGNTLCSDGAAHDSLRRVVIKPLRPHALAELGGQITDEADRLVDHLVGRGSFDAATDLAHHLPLADAPAAYDMFQKKTDGCIKVVLQP